MASTHEQMMDANEMSGADEEERELRASPPAPSEPEIDIRDGDPNDPTWEVEVILRKTVKVRAKTAKEAEQRAVERCADKMWEGEGPDHEETEIVDGPEEDDDGDES